MSGNTMDTFTASFHKLSFVARNLEHAVLTAKELYDAGLITMIERVGEWEDEEVGK
jgi:hypothetical protein